MDSYSISNRLKLLLAQKETKILLYVQ